MANLKSFSIALFGILLVTSVRGSRRQFFAPYGFGGLNYYNNNYANQAAMASSTGSTTAYNQALGYPIALGGYGYPYGAGLGSWGADYPYGLGLTGMNYYNNNYANQAAEASSTGSTTALNSGFGGLGFGGGLNYYNNNYANQAAEASSTGNSTAYNYGASPLGLSGSYYNTNYANQAAEATSTGNTTSLSENFGY